MYQNEKKGILINMSKLSERSRFESRFVENVFEVSAVTGALGVSAGRAGGNSLWTASIPLIAWRNSSPNEPIIRKELQLEWLVDDKEWEQSRDILKHNTVVRLQVRKGENSFMLVQILETNYKDDELEMVLQEEVQPVFYSDAVLGQFELDKRVKIFDKKVSWAGEEGNLSFDWDEDDNIMKSALKTAYVLFEKQDEWDEKIKMYAAEELVELANDWLQDDNELEIDEITKDIFISLLKLETISVNPDGDFDIYFFDGDMFWGHCIIVSGNINGDFVSAEIAG